MNEIFLLSVTHDTAPLALRERLALDAAGQRDLQRRIAALTRESVAIVTCNRTEIYGVSSISEPAEQALAQLANCAGLTAEELVPHVSIQYGDDAVRHLFRVAAGIDSLIIGEPQILGQVRDAATQAREGGYSGPILERLFNYAIVTGKRARHETTISRGAGSVSQAAVELARETLGDLAGRQGLVIGLGEMGQLVARNLAAHGLSELRLCNRSPEPAAQLAHQLHASGVAWDALDDVLATVDIGVSATSARQPILTRPRLESILERRAGRPLLLIDIAVPRDIEPDSRHVPGLHLYDLDQLHIIRAKTFEARARTIPQVEAIIEDEVAAFAEWHRWRSSAPVIRQLRTHADTIREQEVERALRKLGHLDERDREVVRALGHAITNKLLHAPVTHLKESTDPISSTRAVTELFGLEEDE
jgi:glutamyl-tRNA reductase